MEINSISFSYYINNYKIIIIHAFIHANLHATYLILLSTA